jgi:hypothetical protein
MKKTKLEKILIVNDDLEDILAIKARLPAGVEVEIASQMQARMLHELPYGAVIVDNDANNMAAAKGAKTLEAVRAISQDVPVIYTSFQPSLVPPQVFTTKGVSVVRTNEVLDELVKRYSLKLRQPAAENGGAKPSLSLMITYNGVNGYEAGLHGGKLLIVSYDKYAGPGRGQEVVMQQMEKIYKDFEFKRDRDMIKNIFVYDGINGGEWPARLASALGHDARMAVNLMACSCDWERKQMYAGSNYIELHRVECGGERTLGAIADVILGIKRANTSYGTVPISVKAANGKAEKFKI